MIEQLRSSRASCDADNKVQAMWHDKVADVLVTTCRASDEALLLDLLRKDEKSIKDHGMPLLFTSKAMAASSGYTSCPCHFYSGFLQAR